jgi:signal transduction histidine kinase
MRRRLWLALWPAGVVVGITAEYFSIRGHAQENHWLDLAVGWAFIAAGLVAWARRPDNRTGPLMAAVGFTWFIGNFQNSSAPVLVSLGTAFESASSGALAHLILAYPQGRLGRPERVAVAVIYAFILVSGITIALTYDRRILFDCSACPHGGLALFPSRSVYDGIRTVGDWVSVPFAVAVLALLVRRFVVATPPMRRALGSLWLASVLVAVVFVSEGVSGEAGPGAHDTLVEVLQRFAELLLPAAFLYGLFRSRLARAAVADLLAALARPLPPGKLREALARTLGDPSLELGFWFPESDAYIDENGHRLEWPDTSSRRAVTKLEAEGRPLAALIHDPALLEDRQLVDAAGTAARLALENERLQAEVKAQLEEVRASRARIVTAADAERRRVERDLHDGAQQRLVTLSLALRMAQEQAAGDRNGALAATLAEAAEEVRVALSELRELGRGLHPSILTEAGLGPALESLAERSPIPTTISAVPAGRLPAPIEATAYFVVSEALANVAKYSGAASATVRAENREGRLVVEVRDDGVGGADPGAGSGLRGLGDRVAALDGNLRIESPKGGGTRVRAEIPCG